MSKIAPALVQGKDAFLSRPIPRVRHKIQPLTSEEFKPSSLSIPRNVWWWGHGVVLTAVERHRYSADIAA